eukprot:CAMPEP_0175035660 /NCGR_PEP_ID=MMETSP0005-20121125/23348_1 /TAXON_ID=420556 /ORGANISM="Ochromonas sp., Strain CCMP1393" /LENGTH=152 /DNA_ID=CAMNT_0016296753 /DNA_START=593 /DNA_END=1051 /DNA_ORIENTATION=+
MARYWRLIHFAILAQQIMHCIQTHKEERLISRGDDIFDEGKYVVYTQRSNVHGIRGEIEQRTSTRGSDLVRVRPAESHDRPPEVTLQQLQARGGMAQHIVERLAADDFDLLTARAQQCEYLSPVGSLCSWHASKGSALTARYFLALLDFPSA